MAELAAVVVKQTWVVYLSSSTMQGTDVDLGILEGGDEMTERIEEMDSGMLNDVDMILNTATQKGEGFLTWL